MAEEFLGKTVKLEYTKTEKKTLEGEIVEINPLGVVVRHTYRKRDTRLELILRDDIVGIFLDEGAKPVEKKPARTVNQPVEEVEEETTGDNASESEFVDDDEFEDDDDDDLEFE